MTVLSPADRFKGSFVGLMLGDIVGSYFEFSSRGAKDLPSLSVLSEKTNVFGVRFGYTDDTILALLGMEALLASGARYSQSMQRRFARQYVDGATDWSPNGRCFDIGHSTYKSLTYGEWPTKRDEHRSGNGVLMKLAPYAWHRLHTVIQNPNTLGYYTEVADLTHGSPTTIRTAYELGLALECLYSGMDWAQVRATHLSAYPASAALPLGDYRGYAVDSLQMAIWLMDAELPWLDGLQVIVDEGGDTDTNAAIFGMLYGAVHPHELNAQCEDVSTAIHRYDDILALLEKFTQAFH